MGGPNGVQRLDRTGVGPPAIRRLGANHRDGHRSREVRFAMPASEGSRPVLGASYEVVMDDDDSMIDEYLSAAGVVRTFRIAVCGSGAFRGGRVRRGGGWA